MQLSSGRLGAHPPLTRTSDSQEEASCQVTCKGQQKPEASASLCPKRKAGCSVGSWWTRGGYLMAWAQVCASCCQQLAEAVLPTTRVGGAEERTPLLSSVPASLPPMPSIQRGSGTPNAGFLCSPTGFTSSDPFSEVCGKVGLSASSSSFQGPEASGASWSSVVLPDLERNERQGECALPGASPVGLAPLKPEASWSSSPEPTSCITTRIEAETGTRDRGSTGPGPGHGSWLPYCHGSPETPESRRVQLLAVPGGLWGCVDPVTNQRNHLSQILW